MYLILCNPSFEFLHGWEGGVDFEGSALVLGAIYYNFVGYQGPLSNVIVGYGTPYQTTTATPLVAFEVLYLDSELEPVGFYVHGSIPSSIDSAYPTLLASEGELIMAGISVVEGQLLRSTAAAWLFLPKA